MFDWLFEGRLTVYLALIVLALILLGLWTRDRRRWWLLGVGLVAVLLLAYALLDRLVETRQEQIGRKLQEMATAVQGRDVEKIFRHVSDRFSFQGMGKREFRGYVENVMRDGGVSELRVWEVKPLDDEGQVTFFAKPKGRLLGTDGYYRVEARFVKEDGGEWRLESFRVFNPFANSSAPLDVPRFGR